MCLRRYLHNGIKANNALLKLKGDNWIPKLTNMDRVKLKSEPEVYRLSASHLVYELRNYPLKCRIKF